VAGVDGGDAQGYQDVAFAGAGWADNRQIVLCANLFQAG
jgi:hypothetical protein